VFFYLGHTSYFLKKNGMNIKLTVLLVGIALGLGSYRIYAEEHHMKEAINHAEAATKGSDGKAIAKHAEQAKIHAKVVNIHLDTGI
jgi:hypothetical protein